MKKVFIIHGFGGMPNGGWFPWLMSEMEKHKTYACVLPMPNSDKPVVAEWVEEISHAVRNNPEEVYLVGHSLGVPAVLQYLSTLPEGQKIAGAVLVAGLISPLDPENLESRFRDIDPFVEPEINLEKIKNKSNKFIVLHGDSDQTVPFSHAEEISKGLDCELVSVLGGNHFSQRTPPLYYEVPEVLQAVLKILN